MEVNEENGGYIEGYKSANLESLCNEAQKLLKFYVENPEYGVDVDDYQPEG